MNNLRLYLLRRLALLLFVTAAVLTILFVMFKLLPGNPLSVFIDSNFSEEMIRRQKQLWGLDDPLWLQYVRYMWNMLTFNFGTSFFQMTPVRDIVVEKLLHTGAMIVPAVVLSVVLGTLLGSWLGWRRGSRQEGAVVIGLLALRSVPSFFVGIIVLMVFSYNLGWFPPGGMVSIGGHGDSFLGTILSLDFLYHLVLPCLVLMTREITSPALLLRSTMLEVKGSDFLDILRAKGLPERRIVMHATRNALLPLVTDVAVMMGFLFQGQVLLEIIFAWPGVGRELVTALNDLDYPVAQACFFVMALIILMFNFVADVLYAFIDPRVALS
ncbi:MAG: ABC transporter permease [Hyphomicrobiales bacterium]|jgi:peptide/nickel transport system permease protein|nr:ABC transporter permease [Rhodospirillales bacterium]